jgi:hypothetical protein
LPLGSLFVFCNSVALPGWFLLMFFPRARWTRLLILTTIIPVETAVYTFLLFRGWGAAQGGFGSLEQIGLLFETPSLLLAGWVHYLAFDLIVGMWEAQEGIRRDVPPGLMIPCLLLTLLLGPVGLSLFLIVRMLYPPDLEEDPV